MFRRADKQQELDIPSLRLDENQLQDECRPSSGKAATSAGTSTSSQSGVSSKKKDNSIKSKVTPMSHISGVKRALSHTNSFTGERLPKFGVETLKEDELGHVSHEFYLKNLRLLPQYCRLPVTFSERRAGIKIRFSINETLIS